MQAVTQNNSRARFSGLPATLTVAEWQHTLDVFENKCAYCLTEPYQVLEHFVPLSGIYNVGTTANNCIPACIKCNGKKGCKHPDELDGLFPSENLARIRSYLASVS